MPASLNLPSVRFCAAMGRSPCRTWTSTSVCESAAVEKVSVFLVGMVVLRGIMGVATPPRVSMARVSGVTSRSSRSLTSPARTPAWTAAPMATTSSGFTPRCGSLPKSFFTSLLNLGHARLAADENDFVDLVGGDAGIGHGLLAGLERAVDAGRRQAARAWRG